MNEKITQYGASISQYWSNFSSKQKIMLGATLGVLLITIVILIYIFSRTEYELAFQDLDASDAAGISQYLEGNNIAYKLGPDGTSISVPSAVASKVKVDVGSQGLVQNGSIGFDEFSKSSSQFGMTDNEFNVKYKNALNGEVQQLLNGMKGVQKSNVLINLPQESVFAVSPEDQDKASASISMTFKPGYRPTQEEIDGYYNLVKTAVPHLAVEDITISGSQQGELFASSKINGGTAISSNAMDTNFQIQRKYESELKRNIQQFLGQIIGTDNLVISVASSLNFDQKRSTADVVQPLPDNNNNGIIISQAESSETASGTNGQNGGVTGTGETDVPGYQATDSSGSSSSEKTTRTTNYDVTRVKSETVSAPYLVKDLTVSVGVQEGALTDASQKAVTSYLTELVRAQLADSGQNLTDDAAIGKKVTIISQAFVQKGITSTSGVSMAWLIGIGAVALALAGLAGFLIVRRRRQAAVDGDEELIHPAKVEFPTIDLDHANNESQVRKQLEQLAKRKPDDFVNLLRTWLVDE